MKIAHVIPRHLMEMGGLQIFVHNICRNQVMKGHDVYVITQTYPQNIADCEYSIIKIPSLKGFRFLYGFYKYLLKYYVHQLQKKYKFDVWQINGGFPYGTILVDYFLQNKIPSVLRCSGDDIQVSHELNYGVRRNSSVNKLVQKNYPKFSKVIAITKTVVQEYVKLNINIDKIELIPNGVDNKRFIEFTDSFDIRNKYNIPSKAKIVLSVGRNHQKKNYSIIPDIVKYLLKYELDVYWIVIGTDVKSISNEIHDIQVKNHIILIDELSVQNKIKWEVPSDELINFYKQADVFAMTSMLETFGIVLIEAMAAGLPIVCFDVPGVIDVMNDSCGFICPAGEVAMYKEKLLKLLQSDNVKFSKASVELSNKYSWDRVTEMYLDVYSNIKL
jgi:glycosyltransferase involved in cell wall biosynthesis